MIQAYSAQKISTNFVDIMNRIEKDVLQVSAKGKTCIHYLSEKEENKDLIALFLEAEIDGSPNLAKAFLESNGYKVFSYIGVNISWDKNDFNHFDYDRKTGEPYETYKHIEKL